MKGVGKVVEGFAVTGRAGLGFTKYVQNVPYKCCMSFDKENNSIMKKVIVIQFIIQDVLYHNVNGDKIIKQYNHPFQMAARKQHVYRILLKFSKKIPL